MKILIDLDSTLNNCMDEFKRILFNVYRINLEDKDMTEYNLSNVISRKTNMSLNMATTIVTSIFNSKGFFKDLPLLDEYVKDVVDRLHVDGHEITIATKAFLAPNSMEDKREWVRHHFSYAELMFVDNKSNIKCDLAVEDCLEYLNDEIDCEIKILLDKPYNKNEFINGKQRFRAINWDHIDTFIERVVLDEK